MNVPFLFPSAGQGALQFVWSISELRENLGNWSDNSAVELTMKWQDPAIWRKFVKGQDECHDQISFLIVLYYIIANLGIISPSAFPDFIKCNPFEYVLYDTDFYRV